MRGEAPAAAGTRPLRIAYLHQYYQSRDDAGGTRSYEFGRRLVALGHEVHMITTDRDAARARRSWYVTREAGMHVHWLPVPYSNHMSYRRRILSFAQFSGVAGLRAAGVHPDVVFATSTPLTIAVPGLVAARLRRCRFVFEVRDLWPEVPVEMGALRNPVAKYLATRLADAAYRRADAVVALSPGMAEGVVARGYPAQHVTVVPNACDLDLFAPRPQDVAAFRAERPWLGDRPLFVYTGTFGTVNGVDYLVRLAAEVRRTAPDVRFLLMGAGAHKEEVRALAERLGVLDRTVFVADPVPRSRLPVVLGAADVASSVVIPVKGLENNSANKFFDALAAGRPIALNHGGWQAQLITEHGAGLVLDPVDVPAAARLLAQRLHDREWLRAAGRAARGLALDRFDRERLFEVFASVVTGQTVPTAPPVVVDLRDPHPAGRPPGPVAVTAEPDDERGTRTSHGPS